MPNPKSSLSLHAKRIWVADHGHLFTQPAINCNVIGQLHFHQYLIDKVDLSLSQFNLLRGQSSA
jgi:hypothetical protein